MCDYTKVEYSCGHVRYLVRAWCVRYQETHRRCPPNVVAQEWLNEKCGDCRDTSSRLQTTSRRTAESASTQETSSSNGLTSSSSSPANSSASPRQG
ncbi:hypothetical protein K431DRAFT_227085 [Polychaeton citri CBS 116435]|uniref:Uncharacterized protein n=1 Tax=Polychaeton citri CBS 116435 TaxID=1314669 RepID=A0A9P4Q628_9PEZI|nr:hypothetical protein K431DRAFT_227085 [Polychaeton citri CBS 116435]